jgi:glutathione synthase/RimK-type ligase-like ATP-grasp enzyme
MTRDRAPRVVVIHENDAWVEPLRGAFAEIGTPFEEWFLDEGVLDLRSAPPEGVFYNRMSASSHTRGHRYAAEYTGAVLAWLERHGRTVVNDRRALALEISKAAQHEALAAAGIPSPDTLVVVGEGGIADAASRLGFPLVLKHNRGGKGLGVRLVRDADELAAHLASAGLERPVDGVWIVQRYVEAAEPAIVRMEFVGGRFLYAVRVDTSDGFELCPADVCAVPGAAAEPKFRVLDGFADPLVPRLERFLAANGIGVAGVEMIRDRDGRPFVYDVNTNTNYNPEAEAAAGVSGMRAIARHLDGLLAGLTRAQAA